LVPATVVYGVGKVKRVKSLLDVGKVLASIPVDVANAEPVGTEDVPYVPE
jgi:hypothetical protein